MAVTPEPHDHGRSTAAGVALRTAGFVVLGIPIVGFLWTVLSDALAGTVTTVRVVVAVLLLILFVVLLLALTRAIRRLDEDHQAGTTP